MRSNAGERWGTPGNGWERWGTLGNAWECVPTLGNAWECLGTLGNAWECVPTLGNAGEPWGKFPGNKKRWGTPGNAGEPHPLSCESENGHQPNRWLGFQKESQPPIRLVGVSYSHKPTCPKCHGATNRIGGWAFLNVPFSGAFPKRFARPP